MHAPLSSSVTSGPEVPGPRLSAGGDEDGDDDGGDNGCHSGKCVLWPGPGLGPLHTKPTIGHRYGYELHVTNGDPQFERGKVT